MKIETASGFQKDEIDQEELLSNLRGMDRGNDYLILTDRDDYIQCALSDGGFLAEYQDGSGHYSSDDTLNSEMIEKIFTSYLAGDGEWKTLTTWSPEEAPSVESVKAGAETGRTVEGLMSDLTPGNILHSVKKQVEREVGRSVSRKTSGIIGKVIRKFLG